MTYEVEIPERLPSLNEMIAAERTNRFKAAKLKAKSENSCKWYIHQQLAGVQIRQPVRAHFIWYEKNRRRDPDNISGYGHKVIFDALVRCGVLADDGWDEIAGYTDTFAVDKDHPRIVVMLEEVTKDEG